MKSILPQKSVKPNLLSLIVTGIMSHMKYLGVLPPFDVSIDLGVSTDLDVSIELERPSVRVLEQFHLKRIIRPSVRMAQGGTTEGYNRSETPWLIGLMHSPWYNSYNYHYMEGETMSDVWPWFVTYKVDVYGICWN
ncbi:hypothetical protein ACFXTI_034369 [Malus domestica]